MPKALNNWDLSNDGQRWTPDEFILTLNLYYKLPFGKLHTNTIEVQELAKLLKRKAGSIAYRLTNFAAVDPYIVESGRKGNDAGKKQCQPYWDKFNENREELLFESESILAEKQGTTIEAKYESEFKDIKQLKGESRMCFVRTRVNQNVFRSMILNNYNETCAITGINDSRLLIASHIIPWADNVETRLNPENGICLSALYDKAFDQGLITIRPDDYTVMLSPSLRDTITHAAYTEHFGKVENKQIILPEEHKPNVDFLQYHAEEIFVR